MKTNPGDVIALGVIHRVHQRRCAGLGHRAQRFLQNVGQPAFFVAGRRIVVEAAAEARQVLLVARDEAEQSFRHLPVARAAHQQMLGAEASRWSPPARRSRRWRPACREQTPSAGFAVMPENESDPPQFRPSTIFDAGMSTRCSAAACSIKLANLAARGFQRARACRRSIAASSPPGASCAAHSGRGNDRSGSLRSPGPE